MASTAADGALKPLQRAMKLANRAIELDTGNRHRDAYVEYLRSVNFISQFLAEEAEQKVNEALSTDSQKMLKLAEQCLERARTTADKLGKADVNLQSPENCISEVPDPPSAITAKSATSITSTSTSMTSPVAPSHHYGHRRACSDEVQKLGAFPTPEVFQMLRAAEVQRSRKELTPLEEASIQNQKLRAAYEVRLARLNPRQAAQKTSLTLSLQRQMMENLVIAKAREETLQRKAEERRQRLQEESGRLFCKEKPMTPDEEEQKSLYTAVLEYEQDYRWPMVYKEKLKNNPSDVDVISSYLCQILSSSDHPLAKLVTHLQCQIYNRLYPIIGKAATKENSPNKLFCRSLPLDSASLSPISLPKLKSSKSFHYLPQPSRTPIQQSRSIGEGLEGLENSGSIELVRTRSRKDMESSFEDLESFLSPSSLTVPAALQRLTPSQHLNVVVKEIHNARDRLLSCTMSSLNLPSSPHVKDACLDCLEDGFFPSLWPALLALYRQVLISQEESLQQVMDMYSAAMPSVLGVPKKLYPDDIKEPYKPAVEDLQNLPRQRSPQRKLEGIVRTLRVICECTEEYCPSPGSSAIGADDLLPIVAFVVLKSGMSHLLSECAALEEFIHEGDLIGEEGYCLTSLQSALVYLQTLPVPPLLPFV